MLAIIVISGVFLIPTVLVLSIDMQQRFDFKRYGKEGEKFYDFKNRYYSRY